MSEAWANLEDVQFNNATADAYASACRSAANTIRGQIGTRSTAVETGKTEFRGYFSDLFSDNALIASGDATELSEALDHVATQIDFLKDEAAKENERRRVAREWAQEEASESGLEKFGEGALEVVSLGTSDVNDKPAGPQSAPEPDPITATSRPRETPERGSGAGGTSSAIPEKLRSFASTSRSANTELESRPTSLRSHATSFAAECQYGKLDATGVFRAFDLFNDLNDRDVIWATTIADAFDAAGGEGEVRTLSNSSLSAALQARGVSESRLDVTVPPSTLSGVNPTSGYVDDPVNAATGNFIEPEIDFAFGGGCSSLALTRMYNSFDTGTHAFGPGWSSWTEVALELDDEAARMTLPDGRLVIFPRLGDGWDRAAGEALWLERDAAADELRVTDNDGLTWRFSSSGLPLSCDRGEGTLVRFVHIDGRLERLEHERGRHIALTWEDERIVAAETSDGRTMSYGYDEGHLVTATGPQGTRTYRWNPDGIIDSVVDPDGVVELENTYDDQRRVTSQLSAHGRTSHYAYIPGRVTAVSDPDGSRSNTWISDERGRLIGVIDSEDQRQSFAYDSFGNRVMVTERDGSVTVRSYDDRGRLVREVSPSGADLQFAYDDLDRVTRVMVEEGSESVVTYDGASRNPSLMVDPEGGETRLDWADGLLNRLVDPTGVELRFEHNEHGDLVAVTNGAGDTARLEYDDAGRAIAAITPSGHRTTFVHGVHGVAERHDPDGSVWRFEHSTAGRLTTVIDPMGGRTEIERGDDGEERRRIDPLGRATSRRLDDLGNLASIELPDGSSWRFTHDGLSRLTSTTTPDGHLWTRSYNAAGELVETVAPTGDRIEVSTDRASGTVVAQDAAGVVTHRFDELGRPVSAQTPDGSLAIATYDRCGRVVEQLDAEGALTRIDRDAAGRPVAITSPSGDVTRFEHDACGRRSAVVDPLGARTTIAYDADSRPVRVTLPTGEVGWTRYDACGRVEATFSPGVGLSRYSYDAAGRVVEAKDSSHGLRRFTYDAAGQVVATTDGNGGITRYEYDDRGRAVVITDPMGGVTRREFDQMDRCVAETDPLGRTTRAGYDAIGRQAWQEDARGHRTEWSYDGAGRVSSVTLDGRPLGRITRDASARTITLTDTTAPDGREVVHEVEWNRRGHMIRRSRDNATMSWRHDVAGRRESMTLPNGERVEYSYDAASRLVAIDHPLLGHATMEHDATGRVVAATAGGLTQSWAYADGFVVDHTATSGEGATRTLVERDDEGRILSIERNGEVTTYDYDAACQLIEARVGSDSVRWRYDASGRIVKESRPDGSREFAYDAGSQLLAVKGPEGTERHDYDELGRRVRTTFADGSTRELGWSPTGWLASIVDEAGGESVRTELHVDATAELASINGSPVFWDAAVGYAPPLAQVGATPVVSTGAITGIGDAWISPGWRGSRADAADAWGVIGAVGSTAGAHLPAGVGISPAGQLTLGDLEWLGRRVYDSATRGFLSTDPLDPVPGAGWAGNPYSYAGNDPLHALDPTGLTPVTEAELTEMNQSFTEKAYGATKQWVKDNTDYIVGGLIVAAGVGAMFLPIPGAQIIGGALIGAGADVISQRMKEGKDGKINWGQVMVSGAAGAITGGYGSYASSAVKAGTMTAAQKYGQTLAVETVVGGAESVVKYGMEDGPMTWGGSAKELLAGSATGGFSAATGPLSDMAGTSAARQLGAEIPNGPAKDTVQLTTDQIIAKHAASGSVSALTSAHNSVLNQAITDGDVDGAQLVRDTVMGGATRGVRGASEDMAGAGG